MDIIELLTPAYDAAWLPWAVQYFFLIGIAATAALLAAGLSFGKADSACARLLPAVVSVLVVTVIAAPVSLLADLHQPGRFWHFYAHPSPWSWMSLGAFLLPVFVVSALAFAGLWWLDRQKPLRALAILLALSAISILVYTGAEVMVIRSRPLWDTVFLPINFALTGLLGTLGAVLLLARWLPAGPGEFPLALLRRLALAVVIALMLTAVVWLIQGAASESPSFTAMLKLYQEFGAWQAAVLGSILGGLFLTVLVVKLPTAPVNDKLPWLTAVAMLAAAWAFRWIVFMAVQTVPKFGAGLYLQSLPWGSDGVLGMLGVFGLVATLIAALTYVLFRFPPRRSLALS